MIPAGQTYTPPANCKVIARRTVSQVYNKDLTATLARGTPPQLQPDPTPSSTPTPTPAPAADTGFSLFGLSPLGIIAVAGGGYLIYRVVKKRFGRS